jgi:deazaflavin-dependent oxidoreductase (nitroreductase family)
MRTAQELSWNDSLMADFRAHGGQITQGPMTGSPLMILTTIGATSGQPRAAIVSYSRDGEHYVVVGSNRGLEEHPAWFANLRKNPQVTVEVGAEKFQARARVTEGADRRRLMDARIAAMPQFGEYEKKTKRELPVVVLERVK